MTVEEFAATSNQKTCLITPIKELETPKLEGPENKEMPGVRRDIKLAFSEDKGRHLIATEDIFPGKYAKYMHVSSDTIKKAIFVF